MKRIVRINQKLTIETISGKAFNGAFFICKCGNESKVLETLEEVYYFMQESLTFKDPEGCECARCTNGGLE